MKKLIILLCLFLSINAYSKADDMHQYLMYQTDYNKKTSKEKFSAYMLINDPCLYVNIFKIDKTYRYCQLEGFEDNLERDGPYIYATGVYIEDNNIFFVVTNPKFNISCKIEVYKEALTCNLEDPLSLLDFPKDIKINKKIEKHSNNSYYPKTSHCEHKESNLLIPKESYQKILKDSFKQINIKKNNIIVDNPEKKCVFVEMYNSWQEFVINKCQFDEFETLGKDAEIYAIARCKFNEIRKFDTYLDLILSMP